jgi:hypothetical protein
MSDTPETKQTTPQQLFEEMRSNITATVDLLPTMAVVPNVEAPQIIMVADQIVRATGAAIEAVIKTLPLSIDEMVALREAIRQNAMGHFCGGYSLAQEIAKRAAPPAPRPGFRPPVGQRRKKPH